MAGRRGFAALDPKLRREIASRGGRAVPAEKRGWYKNPEAAAEAGRKGGSVTKDQRTAGTGD